MPLSVGLVETASRRYTPAIGLWIDAVRLDPNLKEARQALIEALAKESDWRPWRPALEELLRRDNNWPAWVMQKLRLPEPLTGDSAHLP